MSAVAIVIQKLLAATDVTDLVDTKIWPATAPQGARKPYVLVHKPAQRNRQLLESDAGYPEGRVSVESIGRTASEAEDVGTKAFDALKNVTNEIVGDGQSPETILGREVTIIPTDLDMNDYSDERKSFRRIIDYYVNFKAP